ncbi:Rhotekin-2 [Geodia barretti]|uniref:Rhotekin-2 n=1 Tax=Geodia barretti TaxID=519541 RepID=A0AA35TGJ0_GEOBA|nr:Rhotekin-2 [Geodia barretti]
MADVRAKRKSDPSVGGETVAGKRRHTSTALSGKENVVPRARPTSSKKPRLVQEDPAIERLQERIEMETKIKDGATRLLQASSTAAQSMEASKGMFVSNAKILALLREIQQLRAGKQSPATNNSSGLKSCPAKLAISDIRIPLEWQEFENTHGKVDNHTHFGVFCLFRIGNQVMDTPSLVSVDRSTMDITFRDVIIFPEKVDADFTLEVEVYCSLPPEETASHNRPSTPIKMFKRLRGGSKTSSEDPALIASSSSFSDMSSSIPPRRFAIAGHAHLHLSEMSQTCKTYVLKRGAVGSSGTASTGGHNLPLLPLWGQICCKLMAQPDCATEPRISGFINLQRMVGGLPDWVRLWCVVRQNRLRCWKNPEDVGRRMPEQIIELTEGMVVEPAQRLLMRRPHAIFIKDPDSELYMAFESKEEREQWIEALSQSILDLKVWKSSCDFLIPQPNSKFYVDSPSAHFVPKLRGSGAIRGSSSLTQL